MKLITSIIIPLFVEVPNLGPPKFKFDLKDIRLRVNETSYLKMPKIEDPDEEDSYKLEVCDFGDAKSFVSGQFPSFMIKPKNNETDPGKYEVKILLSDDNPNTLFSSWTFKIYVKPGPPSNEKSPVLNPFSKIKSNPAKTSKKLQVKIKAINP